MVKSKIVENTILPSGAKVGCQSNFRFWSYGGKTFPEWPKLVEGAKITLMNKFAEHPMLP
jgi:hypothetical protein